MKPRKILFLSFLALQLTSAFHVNAEAHEMEPRNSAASWKASRTSYLPGSHPVVRPPGILLPEYVFALPHRWSIGQDIRVCFVGGSSELRKRILSAASEWFKYANLNFITGGINGVDCANGSDFEIRIGFSEPGLWSYIGNESRNSQLVKENLTSMNFEGFDTNPPEEPRFTGVVLHEFGHAMGFEHEHQSPASGCDKEYDWNKLYAYYKSAYNWDKQKVNLNVRQLLNDRSAYGWSQFDPSSIMIYGSKPEFLYKGTQSVCYLKDNNSLSELDMLGARTTYPARLSTDVLRARVDVLEKNIPRLPVGTLKDALNQQLKLSKQQLTK